MSDFKTRLEEELAELTQKHFKLNAFIGTENFSSVARAQQTLLIIQCSAMDTYIQCLEARLVRL